MKYEIAGRILLGTAALVAPQFGYGAPIDPEAFIKKNGYQSKRTGDDGKMPTLLYTLRTTPGAVDAQARDVASLPKHEEVLRTCEFVRGIEKATLVKSTGKPLDVVVANYGDSGKTIACVFNYILGPNVGTKVMYSKLVEGTMYTVYVVN